MESNWCGVTPPAVPRFQEIGHAKRHGRNFDFLMQKTEYLYDIRDSVKREQIKKLMLGTSQTTEYQKWLNEERETEDHVNNIVRFNKESSDGLMFSCVKLPHGDLMNTLDEVTLHLENAPLRHHSMSHTLHRATKTLTPTRIGGKTYGRIEKTENGNQKIKPEKKRESDVEVRAQGKKAAQSEEMPRGSLAPSLDECSPILWSEKKMGFTEPETVIFSKISHDSVAQSTHRTTEILTSPKSKSKTHGQVENTKHMNHCRKSARKRVIQASSSSLKSKVQTFKGVGPTFGHEDEMAAATSGGVVLSETVPSAVTESLSAADQVPASNLEGVTESGIICPSQTVAPAMHEAEIQSACETGRRLSAHAAENMETISDGNERMLLTHEVEFETVPSQTEGTHMKPKLSSSIKRSVEPASLVEAVNSGSSNITAAKPVTASPSEKNEVPLVHKVEAEISGISEGNQRLLESGLDVRRSIQRTVLKILRCMSDGTARRIAVHGIGGIGKTSVLKALSSYPKTKGTFDLIMLVTVTRSWSIRKIQNEVLRQLSLCRVDSETDIQVAERLFQVLSRKRFLLLLDDVWEKLDLVAVGIPDPSSDNGCKILMASRKLDICCDMDVVRVIEMETLSREEAWELFYEQVGGIIDSGDFQPFAQAIVEGCDGLPLLIIITGRALSEDNNISVWERASRKLSPPTAGINHVESVIQRLKFSFDQLKDHEAKSCFLYCCLFSEDQEVNIIEFIEQCIQEGFIAGSRADAHKRGHDIVNFLVRNSLLQLSEGGDSIKMHDLIRDLALGILSVAGGSRYLLRAYSRVMEPSIPGGSLPSSSLRIQEGSELFVSEGHQFLLRAGAGLTEPPSEEEWEQSKMIVLMDNELRSLPERPHCPELLTLFLQRNYQLRVIPMSFFDFMTSLKVLNLSKTRIKSLPKSLFKLLKLEILILQDCERVVLLPSEVGSLECLEVLDLCGTQISKLPDETGKLASLRHLEVSFYGSINYSKYEKLPHELISSGVISRLRSLETLSIGVYPGDQRWYKGVKSVIVEVSNLTELRSLSFHFTEAELLELFLKKSTAWKVQHLTEFKFVVGHDVKSITSRVPEYVEFDYSQQVRCLRFVNGESIPNAVLRTLARSTAFYLDHHLNIRSLTNFGVKNVNGLNFCIISECPKIETVVDSREVTETVLPSLENLSINHLWNLTHIWLESLPKGSFSRLRILSVHACPKLKYVFSSSMVQFVYELEELAVEDCPAIEEIIHVGEIVDSGCNSLPSLKKLTLHYLPGLVNFWTSACPSLEHISFYDCPNLKKMCKDSMSKQTITEIKAEKSWWDALEWEDTELQLHLQDRFIAICEDDL